MIDHEVQVAANVNSQYPEFQGTPAFIINGKMLPSDVVSWDKLQPRLEDALK
jgi:protein-disulfide isomerase